jgi:hypothetical protein
MIIFKAPAHMLRTAAAALAFCVVATGQTISTVTQEITVLPTAISAASPPAIPASLGAAITGGALHIRQQATYDANLKQLRVRTFTVPPQSPNPTPAAAQNNVLDDYTVDVTQTLFGTSPRSMVMIGSVSNVATPSPIGVVRGSTVIYSVGYTQGENGASQFNNTTLVLPGTGVLFAATSSGTLRFVGDATPGTGGTGTGAPVADAGPDITAITLEAQLDGSKSKDPDGDAITYSWKNVGKSASLRNATSATPTVQFGEGFGEYEFELTVTDSKGLSSTDRVKVLYLARFD